MVFGSESGDSFAQPITVKPFVIIILDSKLIIEFGSPKNNSYPFFGGLTVSLLDPSVILTLNIHYGHTNSC